ncbi:amidohydrolase family protein [Amycolatopsis alkalitolerans]|uniref:Amidohydrolase n=1 Tax=Amycolatopsis alkalitolerans TaxID=2547244 RepID=A0A5C4M758_9PSEU|nr:amidohydrolase family protein [Amycolatopsis alkalitolerans]TNC26863.1 amidohydrolase [Amycolatopsis alkalitolerans]
MTTTEPKQRTALVDADIHPTIPAGRLAGKLPEPWRTRFTMFGTRIAPPPAMYPRVRNGGMRLDSFPANGIPGSDLTMLREQVLDLYGVGYGVLIPLQAHSYGAEAPDYGAALCHALNECLLEDFLEPEPRLVSCLCVPHESPDLAIAEIERYAGDPRFVQVLFPGGAETFLGHQKYLPIYRAAAEAGLPVAIHLGGIEHHRGDGWPSFYLEHHAWFGNVMAMVAANLICEGVFEDVPELQIVLVEGGIAWSAPLMWSLDAAWPRLRADVPKLRRRPSEYFREHFWFSTQPIEEPPESRHLPMALRHTGMTDRIMFASDYPHWDFDSPATALRDLPKDLREEIMDHNAYRLYHRLERP